MNNIEVAKELLRRRRAQSGLIDFTRYTFPKYRPAEHHVILADALEQVEAGGIKRLIVTMPPRHGKSELASRRFPGYCLGRDPDKNFISASYNSELASDFGREVRNIIQSPEYQNVFPDTQIAKDSGSAPRWHTNHRGGYVAAGIGTAVTGRGAHIFMIDDPVKDRESAESDRIRQTTYDWYTSTAYTRLESSVEDGLTEEDLFWDVSASLHEGLIKPFQGAIVLIQTRWHDDDLTGRLLSDMERGADQWHIIDMPAIKEDQALWPAKYPLDKLEEIKTAIGIRDFSALYQQKPQPEEGTYFQKDWFNRYENKPANMTLWMTSDFAVSEDKGDFTEHSVWGIDPDNNIYLVDNWHGQTTPDVWINSALEFVRQYDLNVWFGEGGVIRRSVEPFIKKAMEDQDTYIRIAWVNPIGDKPARGRSFQARASMGKVYLPYGPVGDRALDQMLRFPTGKHDDFVDTASAIGQVIDKAHEAFVTPQKKDDINAPITYNDIHNRMESTDQRRRL